MDEAENVSMTGNLMVADEATAIDGSGVMEPEGDTTHNVLQQLLEMNRNFQQLQYIMSHVTLWLHNATTASKIAK